MTEPTAELVVEKFANQCIDDVFQASLNPEPGTFLSLRRAIEISRVRLMSGGDALVDSAIPLFPQIKIYQQADAKLRACVGAILEEIRPVLEKIVARRFLYLDATKLVGLVDEVIDAISSVLRNEYIGLSPFELRPILNDMKRVNICSGRVLDGNDRNNVRLLGVSMRTLHYHLTSHHRAGLIWRIERYTDLLFGLSLFCVLVGSKEFSLAEPELATRKKNRGEPKYLRLGNYADIRRWFDAHKFVDD